MSDSSDNGRDLRQQLKFIWFLEKNPILIYAFSLK